MYYEIYIDQFLAEQLLNGLLLLELASCACRVRPGFGRMFTGSLLSAVLQVIFVMTGLRLLPLAGLAAAAVLVFPKGTRRRGLFFLFLATICFAGTLQMLASCLTFPVWAGSCAAYWLARTLWGRYGKIRMETGREAEVTLFFGERKQTFHALVDTGNQLREPLTGRPVSILEEESADALLGDGWEQIRGFYLIPYHSIGKEKGWMRGVTLDRMYIKTAEAEYEIARPVFAISCERAGARRNYQVILNQEHIQNQVTPNQKHIQNQVTPNQKHMRENETLNQGHVCEGETPNQEHNRKFE